MASGKRWAIEWYATADGKVPMREYMARLTADQHEDALQVIELLAIHGNALRVHSKLVKDGLYELKRFQVRIFFTFRPGYRAVLLDGVVKKKDRLEPSDVERALRMKRDLEIREGRK